MGEVTGAEWSSGEYCVLVSRVDTCRDFAICLEKPDKARFVEIHRFPKVNVSKEKNIIKRD